MDKVNRLLKIHSKFMTLTIVPSAIYVILFFVLLLLSTSHPILTFLVIASVAPGCWLLIYLLFRLHKRLANNINIQLTKIIRQELQKEFESQSIDCIFDVKPSCFNAKNIANKFHLYYSGVTLNRSLLVSISNVNQWINGLLYDRYHIDIFPEEDPTLQSHVVV